MKLYFSPGACSLADHIALHEGGFKFEWIKVDLETKKSADGQDYMKINPKGYVPTLVLDDGSVLTENVAILTWIADQRPALAPASENLGRYRLLEMLAFISTELHKQFKPFFSNGTDEAKKAAREQLEKRFAFIKERIKDDFLFERFSVADCYLFVMLTWADQPEVGVKHDLEAYVAKVKGRPTVQMALNHEAEAK
jgi:glutathione S-transferase